MKTAKLIPSLVLGATLLSTASALADFTGSFSGYYAPGNWTQTISGSTGYVLPPSVITAAAPNNVTIVGSFGSGTVPTDPTFFDYSIVLDGPNVSFTYIFFNPPVGAGNQAQVLINGTPVVNLDPAQTQERLTFNTGDVLDFRLTSVNVSQFEFLQIAVIPEPSTLALAGLSGAALLLQLRRKSAKS